MPPKCEITHFIQILHVLPNVFTFYFAEMSSTKGEDSDKEVDYKPYPRPLIPISRPRPGSGSGPDKRSGPLSYGPIVSSNDDRRRPAVPQRRTTVGPG